jgi:hypothetical protein
MQKLLKITLRGHSNYYYINSEGFVGGQKVLQGVPAKLLGFNSQPLQTITKKALSFKDFWKHPDRAIEMYPIFRHEKNIIVVYEVRVYEVEVCEGKKKNIIYK